jgi:predicted lipoprotein with Yx(FWY)xxD motif
MNRARLPIPILAVLIIAVVAVIAATSSGSAKKTHSSVAADSAVSIEQTSLGKTLADANGRTLYLFEGDKPNVSRLSAAGAAIWPPFTSTIKPQARGGVSAAQIGTIAGTNGGTQVTYHGHPLYYYVGDQKRGQAAGQGLDQFGGRWYVLSAQGLAVTSAASSTPAGGGTSSGAGSGYGY